ncbi:MAG TPA: SRPBCC family protein [Solirubrobacteraceae bacterium]|jgi:hypothetical protein
MRGRAVRADHVVAHPPERVYAFLAQLDNHWHLSDRYLRLERVSGDGRGGRIVIRTPLGLRRTARTVVTTAREPHAFGGTAVVGRRTRAQARWSIEPLDDGARVGLEAIVSSASTPDRLLLALGGRWWLRRSFARVLARLADALEQAEAEATRVDAVQPRPVVCASVA